MKAAGRIVLLLPVIIIFAVACVSTDASRQLNRRTIASRTATVKIVNVSQSPNLYRPWEMEDFETFSGSGAVLKDGTIITNAHVVSNSRYLTVLKENDPKPYEAEILYVGHECDLALLMVKDPAFYIGTTWLEFEEKVPDLNSVVTTFGYPLGGERISITKGVVSRIEIETYIHQWKSAFIQVQTDAAINPGNSGGPVVQNGRIVGIAVQGLSGAENIGYMIPSQIVNHFLDDVSDGTFDGFPDLGVAWANLENPDYRGYLGMTRGQTGVLVKNILPGSSADGYIRPGDAILEVEGTPIGNDGSIMFENGRIMFTYLIDDKQVGDSVVITLLRKGGKKSVQVPLFTFSLRIPNYYEFEKKPRYLIYGGIVFQRLSLEYLNMWDEWWDKADPLLLYYFNDNVSDNIFPEREEFVVINKILPGSVNLYMANEVDGVVDTVNGIPIHRLEDVLKAVEHPVEGYTVITLDNSPRPIVLDAEEAERTHADILKQYGIASDRELN